jgi:fatty acid desaturase
MFRHAGRLANRYVERVPAPGRPLWRRLMWFVALWAAGVLAVAGGAALIRLALP